MHPFPCDYSEDKGEGCITLFPMICTLWADSPYPSTREGIHDNLNWVSADALEEYHMLRADMLIVKKIQLEHYDMCISLDSMEN